MVTIIDVVKRENKDGESFMALILQGGIELVKSQDSGRFYATAKKASITSTFDETTAKSLIGQKIPGSVKRTVCQPYEFTVKETGEVLSLSHRWEYTKEAESIEERVLSNKEVAMPL